MAFNLVGIHPLEALICVPPALTSWFQKSIQQKSIRAQKLDYQLPGSRHPKRVTCHLFDSLHPLNVSRND